MDANARIKDEAREWLIRLAAGAPTQAERARFDAWRRADLRHADAYRRVERLWNEVPQIDALSDPALLEGEARQPRRLAMWATAAALGGVAITVWFFLPQQPREQEYATRIAEIRDFELPDGSVLTLGGQSTARYSFDEHRRQVTLTRGEAFFSVTADRNRPFVVDAGETRVRVLGTQFDIRRGVEGVRVSVLSGKVAVSGEGAPVTLTAGQQIRAPATGALERPQKVDRKAPGAWREGRLSYVDAPLSEVIADLNRYSSTRIDLARPEIGNLRLSATFRTDQVEQLLGTVTRTLALDTSRGASGTILLDTAPVAAQ